MMPEDMSLTVEEVLRRARRDASEAKEAREKTAEVLKEERARFQESAAYSAKRIAELEAKVAELQGHLNVLLGPTTTDLETRYLEVVAERLAKEQGHDAMSAGRQLVSAAVGFPRLLEAVRGDFVQQVKKAEAVERFCEPGTAKVIYPGPISPFNDSAAPQWARRNNLLWFRFVDYGPNMSGRLEPEDVIALAGLVHAREKRG